jgi:hypothetical protein
VSRTNELKKRYGAKRDWSRRWRTLSAVRAALLSDLELRDSSQLQPARGGWHTAYVTAYRHCGCVVRISGTSFAPSVVTALFCRPSHVHHRAPTCGYRSPQCVAPLHAHHRLRTPQTHPPAFLISSHLPRGPSVCIAPSDLCCSGHGRRTAHLHILQPHRALFGPARRRQQWH